MPQKGSLDERAASKRGPKSLSAALADGRRGMLPPFEGPRHSEWKDLLMNSRKLAFMAPTVLLGAFALAAYGADAPATHDGKVVSATAEKLMMSDKDGKEHSHALTGDIKITVDGKTSKATDLKKGFKIRVTTKADDNKVVTRIEALDKNPEFEKAA
jgi:hypothetical protein